MTARRVVATTLGPSAPIRLAVYEGADLVAAVDLDGRQALRLAADLLGLALRKPPGDPPTKEP